jgi:hypothetical protein
MSVTVHTATVYKTSARGRRYFSKRQAWIADAIARLRRKYDPEGCDYGFESERSYYTAEQMNEFYGIAERYYRRFGMRKRKVAP